MIKKISYKAKAELPYNPDDVNIRLQHFRVSELISMIDKEALDLLDDDYEFMSELTGDGSEEVDNRLKQVSLFGDAIIEIIGDDDLQRNPGLWNNVQKSQFIESLMINIPVPLFYFDGSSRPWRVIDGLQRLHTILSFTRNEFKLAGLEYLKKYEGARFKDDKLPGYMRARVLDAQIIAYVINPGTPPDVKYNIFKRINTGGLKLTGQEIRNAFYRGAPAKFTKKLALLESFQEATNHKVSSRRMLDREYVNRFIAFHIFDYREYNSKMDLFLSIAMSEMLNPNFNFSEVENSFDVSMKRCIEIFGDKAFYRPKQEGGWGRSPNKALFDTMSWNMAKMEEDDFRQLKKSKTEFAKRYKVFMNEDKEIYNAIDNTTAKKTSVLTRFEKLNYFIKDFIQ